MMADLHSVPICNGHRISRNNHERSREKTEQNRSVPFFCAFSVTAERTRNEMKKKRHCGNGADRVAPVDNLGG